MSDADWLRVCVSHLEMVGDALAVELVEWLGEPLGEPLEPPPDALMSAEALTDAEVDGEPLGLPLEDGEKVCASSSTACARSRSKRRAIFDTIVRA